MDRSKFFFTAQVGPCGAVDMRPCIRQIKDHLSSKFSIDYNFLVRMNATCDVYEVIGEVCPTADEQAELEIFMRALILDFITTLDSFGKHKYEWRLWNLASDFADKSALTILPVWRYGGDIEFSYCLSNKEFRVFSSMNRQNLFFILPDIGHSLTCIDVKDYLKDYFLTLIVVFTRLQLRYYKEVMRGMLMGDWILEQGLEMAGKHILAQLDEAAEGLVKCTPPISRIQELSQYANFDLVSKCLNGGLCNREQVAQEWQLRELIVVANLSRPWEYEGGLPGLWVAKKELKNAPAKLRPPNDDRPKMPYLPPGCDVLYVEADNMFMVAARQFAEEQSACSWWPTGAVLVKNEAIIGHGANSGHFEAICPRLKNNCPTGEGYNLCASVCQQEWHAEVSAIEHAREHGVDLVGADLYLFGHWWLCENCWKRILAAGIRDVYLLRDAHKVFTREARIAVMRKLEEKLAAGEIVTSRDAIWQL